MNPLVKDFKKTVVMDELKKMGFNRQQRREWKKQRSNLLKEQWKNGKRNNSKIFGREVQYDA